MSGSKNSIILRQLEELAEVTSAAPNHKLEDANLQTPPRNRLLLPFSSKVILSDSNEVNEVEPSPDQFPKGSFSQPYEEVSPTPGRNVLFLQDCILANLAKNKAIEKHLINLLKQFICHLVKKVRHMLQRRGHFRHS